ncbi:MAG: hypothetical protein ACNA8W_10775 [Bradymonadaceae bacterium]
MNPLWAKPVFGSIALLFFAVSLASPALAQQMPSATGSQKVTLTLLVPQPDEDEVPDAEVRRRQHAEMARMTMGRIEERLKNVGVKDFDVKVLAHGQVQVIVRGRWTRDMIAGIIIPAGRMELRPVVQTGEAWTSLASSLPKGVEIRQEETSFNADDAYLWSGDYSTLEALSRRVSLGTTHVFVYPDDDGWRTISLAAPVATHRDLNRVTMRNSPAGMPFVMMDFKQDTAHRVRESVSQDEVTRLAIVIDDEIVSIVRYGGDRFNHRLEVVCPAHLLTTDAQRAWVQQVVGRLAVPMPITLAEM